MSENKKTISFTEQMLRHMQRHRLGDKVAAVTSALGIKPCDGCKDRQAYLNGERSPDN